MNITKNMPPETQEAGDGETARVAALLKLLNREAEKLAREQGDRVRELLAGGSNYEGVARQVLSAEQVERSIEVSTNIVMRAAHALFDGDEAALEAITKRNRQAGVVRGGSLGGPKAIKETLKVQGKAEWSDAERARLDELIQDPACQYQGGRHNGDPIIDRVMDQLNQEFLGVRPPRTRIAVKREINSRRSALGLTPKEVDWDLVGPRLLELCATVVHPAGTQHAGAPDLNAIVATLNAEFPGQPQITRQSAWAQWKKRRLSPDAGNTPA